jgi:biotin carboxylase
MHIAFVDANPAALEAIRLAKVGGHRVTFLQSADPLYPMTERNRRIIGMADRLVDNLVTTDAEIVTSVLADCHATDPIDVVTSQHEMSTETVAVACRALGLRGTSPEAVLIARRKDRCRHAISAAGLSSAAYAVAENAEQAVAAAGRIGFPVVVKPPSGGDSLLAHVAYDAGQVRAACQDVLTGLSAVPTDWRPQFRRGILVEEFLAGKLVSVELGARDERFFPFCVSGRFRWGEDEAVELGSFIPSHLPADQEAACVAYAIDVCKTIGLDLGVFHIEIVQTEHGPVLVEVNPRVMGGALPTIYRHATGQDIYGRLLQVLTPGAAVDIPEPCDGITASRKLIAREDGVLARDASVDWLQGQPEVIAVIGFDSYHAQPGQAVAAGQVVARFLLRCPDYPSIVRAADRLMPGLQRSLGIKLMTGDKDVP